MTPLTIGGAANTLTYEGGLGADTIKSPVLLLSSTIYGDNASATDGGADSISIAGQLGFWFLCHLRQSGSNDSISTVDDSGVTLVPVYGGSGKDSVWIVNGASTASLIDGGVGNDFLSLGGLSGTSSLLGGAGEDTITVAGGSTQWLVDGGDDNDTIAITNAAERTFSSGWKWC